MTMFAIEVSSNGGHIPTVDPASRLAGQIFGHYVLDCLVGTGGMGEVYAARHMSLGRRVAIKVLRPAYAQHPEAIGRFYQEARVASDIKHPFVIDILDFGTTADGVAYYAMELLSGRTLADAIDERALTAVDTCHVRQVCAAAHASHEAGVVHRDIKPANIKTTRLGGRSALRIT